MTRDSAIIRGMEMRLSPGFLIAMPQLEGPNFARTVVLLVHHDDEGAMGLVVNRRTDVELDTFCRQHDITYAGGEDRHLHLGGPCELQRGFLLHQEPKLATHHVGLFTGVYLSTQAESVRAVLEKGRRPYTFLLGYAGWGKGQLEREIAQGSWLTADAHASRIFDSDAENVWTRALGDLGIDTVSLAVSTQRH